MIPLHPVDDATSSSAKRDGQPVSASRASSARAAALGFVAILALLYLPIFLGRIIFTRDIAHWIFPAQWFVRQSLRAGELPLWNPYQGLGFPVLGDPLYGVFYPPNWFVLLAGPTWVANAVTALGFLHMVWGGLGVLLLGRRLRLAPLPSAVAALAWSLSGYITAQWTAGLLLHAAAWIPWAAVGHLALLDELRAGGRRWMLGLVKAALPTGFALLMGEVFLAVMGAGLAIACVVLVLIAEGREEPATSRLRPRWIAAHALAFVLAFGVGAIVLIPARAVMSGSPRASALPRAEAEVSSLHPLRLLEFAAPGCMGDVYGDYPAAPVVGEPRLDGLPLSYSVYLGASVLALVLIAMRRRFLVLGLAGVTGFALLVAFGKHLPVHQLVRRLIPPLAYMRFPEKYMAVVVVGVALLAGLGAQRMLLSERGLWRRTLGFLLAVIATAALAPFLFSYPWSGFMAVGLRHAAVALAALLGAQVLAARGSRLAGPLLVAVVVLDLAVSTWALQTFVPRDIASVTPMAAGLLKTDYANHPEPPRIYRSRATDAVLNRQRTVSNAADGELRLLATLTPNTVNVWGIASLPGYDAAIPALLNRLWDEGWQNPSTRLATLRLVGADYAVLPAQDDSAKRLAGMETVADPVPGARLVRVTASLPPVYLAGRSEPLPDPSTRLFDQDVVSGEVALVSPDTQALAGQPGRAGTCLLTGYSARRVQARCQATREALAVFVEQYDPGWRATVDGAPVPVVRANLVMRAVRVPPGDHMIAFEYRAPGLRAGVTVTILALAVLLGLAAAHRSRR